MTAARRDIPFGRINEAALAACPGLLFQWFPKGRIDGREFRIGDLQGNPEIAWRSISILACGRTLPTHTKAET
jgi:hypothetical protein